MFVNTNWPWHSSLARAYSLLDGLDESAPNDLGTNIYYESTPETTYKLLFEILGGVHATVTSPYYNADVGPKALYWIEKFVLDDPTNCNLLIAEPPMASQFMTNVECQTVGDINGDDLINVIDVVQLVEIILNPSQSY